MLRFEDSASQPKIERLLISINTGGVGVFHPLLPMKSHNFKGILEDSSVKLKKDIERFIQNNIDWVKIRNTTGVLDYSKPFLRNTKPKKEAV